LFLSTLLLTSHIPVYLFVCFKYKSSKFTFHIVCPLKLLLVATTRVVVHHIIITIIEYRLYKSIDQPLLHILIQNVPKCGKMFQPKVDPFNIVICMSCPRQPLVQNHSQAPDTFLKFQGSAHKLYRVTVYICFHTSYSPACSHTDHLRLQSSANLINNVIPSKLHSQTILILIII
jgi:hypothetical protein